MLGEGCGRKDYLYFILLFLYTLLFFYIWLVITVKILPNKPVPDRETDAHAHIRSWFTSRARQALTQRIGAAHP